MNKKRIIIVAIVTTILAIATAIFGIKYTDEDVNKISDGIETITNIIEDNLSTTDIPELTELDEQTVEVQETESEAFEEQGEIAYNGSTELPHIELGDYAGLTYYSQIDSRWKNHIYTSIGDSSQTIGTSGCGPTSAAMIVSSIRGTITPDVLGNLFVHYGYRSANSGTYWSAFKWTADVFDIEYSESSSLDEAVEKLRNSHYVIVSCNQGLFTYGGHFIVLVGIERDTLKIYDPYLYAGKFETSTRRDKVTVLGNTVYCSIDNFRNYANAKGYFCFKNDREDVKDNPTTPVIDNNVITDIKDVNYKAKVTANSGLNIRSGASTSYSILGGYSKNTIITVTAENKNWGKTNLGWICLDYTTKLSANSNSHYSTGNYRVTASVLNVRFGPGTNYKTKTYNQLSANAKSQNKQRGNYYCNGYMNGVICTVTQVKNNWGLTASGWICLDYCSKI